jgi:hypothetical protein
MTGTESKKAMEPVKTFGPKGPVEKSEFLRAADTIISHAATDALLFPVHHDDTTKKCDLRGKFIVVGKRHDFTTGIGVFAKEKQPKLTRL